MLILVPKWAILGQEATDGNGMVWSFESMIAQ